MRFIIRVVFWLAVIILLLPSDPNAGPDAPQVTFMQALNAVRGTINDLSQFCTRNPDLCATGGDIIAVAADKARYGIEQIQAYLDHNTGGADTLTAEDTNIPWQGSAAVVAEDNTAR
jgi:hypothetical protein